MEGGSISKIKSQKENKKKNDNNIKYRFFFSSRRRHTRYIGDWSSDVCSSDLREATGKKEERMATPESKLTGKSAENAEKASSEKSAEMRAENTANRTVEKRDRKSVV